MVGNHPKDNARAVSHIAIAWPTDVLYENGQFAGFLMPRINKSPDIFEVFNPQVRAKNYPQITWLNLHRISRNLALVFNDLHSSGYIIIGDVNQKNILVTQQSYISLVDTDSFQVRDSNGTTYRCHVGVPEYTAPEIQGIRSDSIDRTAQHDNFGLAVIIFQLLMDGFHPFTGTPNNPTLSTTLPLCIKEGAFAYHPNSKLSPSPNSPAFSTLNPNLQQLFIRCFVDGHKNPALRPTASDWRTGLEQAEKNLAQCSQSHWYSTHQSKCPKCSQKAAPVPPPVPSPAIQTYDQQSRAEIQKLYDDGKWRQAINLIEGRQGTYAYPNQSDRQKMIDQIQEQRNGFLVATLILSPIIYSIVGAVIASAANVSDSASVYALIGGIAGFVITGIYDASSSGKDGRGKDWALGLTLPGIIAAGLAIVGGLIYVFCIIIIVLVVIGGLLGGG